MCVRDALAAEVLGSAWCRLPQEKEQEFGTRPVPPAVAVCPPGHQHAEAADAEKSHAVRVFVHTCGCRLSPCAYVWS